MITMFALKFAFLVEFFDPAVSLLVLLMLCLPSDTFNVDHSKTFAERRKHLETKETYLRSLTPVCIIPTSDLPCNTYDNTHPRTNFL